MYHVNRDRKARSAGLYCLHDVSHIKLMDIFKSLRHRRLRRNVSRRTSLTNSRTHTPPITDDDFSLVQPTPPIQSQIPSPSSSLYVLHSRSDASTISASEEDHSSGMSTSISVLDQTSPDSQGGSHHHPYSVPPLPSSPSTFQLRSEATKDYLIERLEQHLGRLSLADASPGKLASSVGRITLPWEATHVTPMDVCLESQNLSPRVQRMVNPASSPAHVCFGERPLQGLTPTASPYEETVVPMIVITSVDAKDTRPLPPSAPRPSRTPFGHSNLTNLPTDNERPKFKGQMSLDDPFMTPPNNSAYSLDYNLSFHLPSFPSIYPTAGQYFPETPTPMNCNHFGDCSGDLWEVLHPPLVSGLFTLPPFELPPLKGGIFDGILVSQP